MNVDMDIFVFYVYIFTWITCFIGTITIGILAVRYFIKVKK